MKVTVGALVCAALLLAGPAFSHHSQSMYDTTKETTFKGVVTKFEWTNPHSWLYVDVTDEQGAVAKWEFETLSPNNLARAGWKRTQLKPGDQVTVVGNAQRDGVKRARLNRVVMADGMLLRPGREPGQP